MKKCEHSDARTVTHLGRGVFEETDIGILWCPTCGALGAARYADGEWIRWRTPERC